MAVIKDKGSYERLMTPEEYAQRLAEHQEKKDREMKRMHQSEQKYLGETPQAASMPARTEPSITHKAAAINDSMSEISAMMNELSFRLYGHEKAKIEPVPGIDDIISINQMLDQIATKAGDISLMLRDFMESV